MSFAATLKVGDAVRAQIFSDSSGRVERIVVEAIVVESASIRNLHSTTGYSIRLNLTLPKPLVFRALPSTLRCAEPLPRACQRRIEPHRDLDAH